MPGRGRRRGHGECCACLGGESQTVEVRSARPAARRALARAARTGRGRRGGGGDPARPVAARGASRASSRGLGSCWSALPEAPARCVVLPRRHRDRGRRRRPARGARRLPGADARALRRRESAARRAAALRAAEGRVAGAGRGARGALPRRCPSWRLSLTCPGAGAAGGLGAALAALGGELVAGADAVLDLIGFDPRAVRPRRHGRGHGRPDDLEGKAPAAVARRCARRGRPLRRLRRAGRQGRPAGRRGVRSAATRAGAGPRRARRAARRALLGVAEQLRQRLQQLPGDRSRSLDERPELPGGRARSGEVGLGRDRRRPRALVDQRDLAEVVARAVARAPRRGRVSRRCPRRSRRSRCRAVPSVAIVWPASKRALLERPREPSRARGLDRLREERRSSPAARRAQPRCAS